MENDFVNNLLDVLEDEIKDSNDAQKKTIWDRGFEDGRMAEALRIRVKIRGMLHKAGMLPEKIA